MKHGLTIALGVGAALWNMTASAQENYNVKGARTEAIIATERERDVLYNGDFQFSPAVRAGDFLFFSGVVAGAGRDEQTPFDEEAYKASVRRGFEALGRTLAAAGADFSGAVKITTFHVFDSPLVALSKVEQVRALAEVKSAFIPEPHPAWTAVGTTALLPDRGLVEIEITVYAPQDTKN